MKDSILCCAFCLGLGMVVGGVIVSNNSKLRGIITKTQNKAMEVYEDVKEELNNKSVQNKMTQVSKREN